MSMQFAVSLAAHLTVLILAGILVYRQQRAILEELRELRYSRTPPDVGGRKPPTPLELAAARNRIDSSGTAHPGTH